jgi:signal transduction histidine kinase
MTALIIMVRLALNPYWGQFRNRHLLFFPTIMLAAWLGGFGPGVVTVVITTLAIDYFWMEPPYSLAHFSSDLLLFPLIGIAICALIQSLHVARARADAASQSRERVLAIVAHDLRNPLTAVKMAAERMRQLVQGQDRDTSAEQLRRVSTVERAASRMDHLIRDLVDATHVEQDRLSLVFNPEDPESIVRESVELVQPVAQERGITLEARPAANLREISCDRDRLMQVLGNLLGNALEFTPEGGQVVVRTAADSGGVRFEVEDTGPGIKAEDLPHLFERYWKAGSRGTGLGLFIAQSVVRGHGGRIEVESRPGVGARFYFTVPCRKG